MPFLLLPVRTLTALPWGRLTDPHFFLFHGALVEKLRAPGAPAVTGSPAPPFQQSAQMSEPSSTITP